MKSKKGQVLIFAGIFLILLLLVSYSQETRNSYKVDFSKDGVLANVLTEACQVGIRTNGTFLDSRFATFETDVDTYCQSLNITCNVNITKDAGAPTNVSLLNYTHYTYEIDYYNLGYNYSASFTC